MINWGLFPPSYYIFLTWPAFSASFLPVFPCLVLICVLIHVFWSCFDTTAIILQQITPNSVAHNYAKGVSHSRSELGIALPATSLYSVLWVDSKNRLLRLGLRIAGSLGQVAVAGTPETKPSCARTPSLCWCHIHSCHWLNLVTWSQAQALWSGVPILPMWNEEA